MTDHIWSFHVILSSFDITSDLAEKYGDVPSGRVNIPISDEDSSVTYYLVCQAARKKAFASLFAAL